MAAAPVPCSTNPDWWFSTSAIKVAKAKQLCASCHFQTSCHQIAVEEGSEYGIWAGHDIRDLTTPAPLQTAGAA